MITTGTIGDFRNISLISTIFIYFYWQYHLTIFAILIPKWWKYPILGSKINRGDITGFISKVMKKFLGGATVEYFDI